MKKKLLIAAGLVLLLIVCFAIKLFVIGEPVDGNQLSCTVEQHGQNLHLDICTPASAIALKGWKYRQEGTSLYLSCRKVMVSSLYSSGTYDTTIPNISRFDAIYLGGRLIWSS